MGSNYHIHIVNLQEFLDDVGTEFLDRRVGVHGISGKIWHNSALLLSIRRIVPQEIYNSLLLCRLSFKRHMNRSLELLNLFDLERV